MTDPAINSDSTELAAALMMYYSFDLAGQSTEQLIQAWIHNHPVAWLGTAVVEALYQGRYKAISVGQILQIWSRRGHPICHFNLEFEAMVCAPVAAHRHGKPGTDYPLRDSGPEVDQSAHPSSPSEGCYSVNSSSMSGTAQGDSAPPDNANRGALPQEIGNHQAWLSHHFEKVERLAQGCPPGSESPKPPTVEVEKADKEPQPEEPGTKKSGRFDHHSFLEKTETSTSVASTSATGLPPSPDRAGQPPIHRFMPHAKPSGFYNRLQAIASSDSPPTAAEQVVDLPAQLSQASSKPASLEDTHWGQTYEEHQHPSAP